MPIHDFSYHRFEGERTGRARRIWALARSTIVLLTRRRSFLLLMAACWVPSIVRAAQIYVSHQFASMADVFEVGADTWREFLTQQILFLPVVLASLYAGAGAIASDLASGALVIYLSKPISRWDYVVGKALPVVGAVAFVTLVPALALLLLHLGLSGDAGLLAETPLLPLAVVGYSLWIALYFALSVLALSSLTRSSRIAGAGFVAVAFGSEVLVRNAIARLSFGEEPTHLSLIGAAVDVGHLFFGDYSSGRSPLLSLTTTLLVMGLAAVILERRLHGSELAS